MKRYGALACFILLLTLTGSADVRRQNPDLHFEGPKSSLSVATRSIPSNVETVVELAPAAVAAIDQIEAMREWNRLGNLPVRVGFERPLKAPVLLQPGESVGRKSATRFVTPRTVEDGDRVLVAARVAVENSTTMRARLSNVRLGDSARVHVWGSDGIGYPVDLELVDDEGGIWAPAVSGPEMTIELSLDKGDSGTIVIEKILELFLPRPEAVAGEECVVDASCFDASTLDVIEPYGRAVAQLLFVDGGNAGLCTGALVNDTDDTTAIPYLLTANHCFSSQSVAQSLEAYWDYKTASCGGSAPEWRSGPRSVGSTLLATSASTDVTLVRLSSVPSDRVALGWDARPEAVVNGTVLHRISHPYAEDFGIPYPQSYSRMVVDTDSGTCEDTPRPNYIYSRLLEGATISGSSGAPVILAGGLVVGQLLGGCGPDDSVCSQNNREVDGALSVSWPLLASYLAPSDGGPLDPCVPDETTACLLGDRFKATLRYRAAFDNQPVDSIAPVKPVTGFADPNFETAFFYFNSPNNIEVMLKMLDQGNTNSQGQPTIAVLFGTATPLRAEITITDTERGTTRIYTSE
ncbi:MAG: serine protease, partial [Thermoanaerobaculia bacterium]|nr:serine protease [Thermoanaerobaculia bacterium]